MMQGPEGSGRVSWTILRYGAWGRPCQESIGLGLEEEEGGEKAYGRRKVGVRVRTTGCPARLGQMKGQLVKQKRRHMKYSEAEAKRNWMGV